MTAAISRSLSLGLLLVCASAAGPGRCAEGALPWRGKIDGYSAYVPDRSRPLRAAFINAAPAFLPDDDPDWRAAAAEFNSLQLDIPLDYFHPDASARKILDALKAASRTLPGHPEIEHLGVVLFGFSASSAAVSITASSKLLSNPDPALAPQRVLAVICLDELDQRPYIPPPSVPQLFLSDPGDGYGGLLTDVEHSEPKISHDALARGLAKAGAPLTVVSQPGHWHGGSVYGYNHISSASFLRVWLTEVLEQRLPPEPSTSAPALAPDWRGHAGWLGTYDVATKTATEPWGDSERMVNVAIAPRAEYRDSRPFIWLPSQHAAEVWRDYATTGSMPPLTPDRPMAPLYAFLRPGPDPAAKLEDLRVAIAPGEAAAADCGFASGEASLIVAFDRAVKSGEATAEGATIEGEPRFWSNVMIVRLKSATPSGPLRITLTHLAPADGGPLTDAAVTATCR